MGAMTSCDRTVWARRPLRPPGAGLGAALLALCLLATACTGGPESAASSSGTPGALGSAQLVDRTAEQFGSDLDRLKGRVVVVNFWASWCAPCRAEMPDLERASRELAGEPVTFIGVDSSDERSKAVEALARAGVTYPTVYDRKGIYGGLASRWSVTSLPQTWFVDREGRHAVKIARQVRPGEVRATVDRLLAAP
jgi:thiol-disulfide isomerase/thioredoxin